MMKAPLGLVGIGCGGRTRTYCELAAAMPDRYRVIAAADPNPARVEMVRKIAKNPDFRSFPTDDELLAAGKLGDVCIIGTQDSYHVEPAMKAMEAGYDLLLEKPIADDPVEILHLLRAAERLRRKVLVCHVLRYSPFYVKVKQIVDSGILGRIITIDAREGVGPWHQAHSYVRGHWSVTGRATPMLIAKSCHDMDIISWMARKPCTRVSSFGGLTHFTPENRPAGAPDRCVDGCPVADTCIYNAALYASRHRDWLQWVMDGGLHASSQDVLEWLRTSPWGRCVYACDNDAVDHQVVAMEFAGGCTGTFTMTAFDSGRDIVICGTEGRLRGGDNVKTLCGSDIVVNLHAGDTIRHEVSTDAGGYEGHGGGDPGLVDALDVEMAKPADEMRSGLPASVESHFIGYAAEESRRTGTTVDLASFRDRLAARLQDGAGAR